MAVTEIRLQGRATILRGGKERQVPASAQPLLLALVAAGRNGASRDRVVHSLWPDEPEGKARRRLNTTLWRLRETVDWHAPDGRAFDTSSNSLAPASAVLTSNGWLSIDWSKVRVDAAPLFELAVAHPSLLGSLPIARLEQCAAVDIEQLLGGCDHEYVLQTRRGLRRAHTEACTQLAARTYTSGDFIVSAHWARQGLSADPYREDLHQLVIRALHRSGRRADATAQYEQCVRLLADDLGVEPLPETAEAASGHFREDPQESCDRNLGPDLDDLRASLEEAVKTCEQVALAGRKVLNAIDGPNTAQRAVRDCPVTVRNLPEIDLR